MAPSRGSGTADSLSRSPGKSTSMSTRLSWRRPHSTKEVAQAVGTNWECNVICDPRVAGILKDIETDIEFLTASPPMRL